MPTHSTASSATRALAASLTLAISSAASAQNYVYSSQFGVPGAGAGQFSVTNSLIMVPGTDRLLVAQGGNNAVQLFTRSGTWISQFGVAGTGDGQFSYPTGLAIDRGNGNIVVTDYYNQRVQLFSPQGTYINQFGSSGAGAGQFLYPCDVAIDPVTRNRIVSDGWGARVQIFGAGGNFLRQFGTQGAAPGQFQYACGLAIDPVNGHVLVADQINDNIQVFNSNGDYLGRFAGPGAGNGQLDSPGFIAFDAVNRNVLVTDYGNDRVQVFAPNGSFIDQFSSTGGSAPSLVGPTGIATDPVTHKLYVADRQNQRVAVFAPASSSAPCGATVVSLSVAPLTAQTNQSILFSARASISAPFSGTVSFIVDGGATTCTASMRDVAAMCTSPLQPGAHSIVAQYSGDGTNAPGCSAPQAVNVIAQGSTAATAIGCSVVPNPVVQGQPVRVECDVSGAVTQSPFAGLGAQLDGYVTLAQGSTILTHDALTFASVGFTTAFSGGGHPLTATYSGDALNAPTAISVPLTVIAPDDGLFFGDFDAPAAN